MKDYLSDLEVVKVEAFCADNEMYEAVRKVILQSVYSHGVMNPGEPHDPLQNRALALVGTTNGNDAELGAGIRAWWEGINALEVGYKELRNITSKKEDSTEEGSNIAE